MENLNTLTNDVQEPVVEAPQPEEVSSEDAFPAGEDVAPEEDAQAVAKPEQTPEENHANANLRRAKEAAERRYYDTERALQAARQETQRLMEAVAAYGYKGSPTEIAAQIIAARDNSTTESVAARWEAEQKALDERIQHDPRVQRAMVYEQQMMIEAQMQRDLLAIKNAFPTETATRLDDIKNAKEFAGYIKKGYDAVDAYRLANMSSPPKTKPNDKGHMVMAGGGAGSTGLADIPRDELSVWREGFPNDTPAQLKERYNRHLKRIGG